MDELVPDENSKCKKEAQEYIEKWGLEILNEDLIAQMAKQIGIKEIPCPNCKKLIYGEKYSKTCKHCGCDLSLGEILEEF